MELPDGLAHLADREDGRVWRAALPGIVASCARRWSLRLGDPYPGSHVSLALRAQTRAGAPVVLKIRFPHRESECEAEALALWNGDGAVRLLEHDPERAALLLEACQPGTSLARQPADRALAVYESLLPRLWRPAEAPFTPLAEEARRWAGALGERWQAAGRPFEASLLDDARDRLLALAASQGESVLLHQDLHPDNVLAAEREPWLAIDPKPLVGERAFGLAPIVRAPELGHGESRVIARLDRLSDSLGVDRERVRGWALGQSLAWAFEGRRVHGQHVETARWLARA